MKQTSVSMLWLQGIVLSFSLCLQPLRCRHGSCEQTPAKGFGELLDAAHCLKLSKVVQHVQVHKRVRLAIRLDDVQRQQTKEKAEHTWRKRSADEVSLLSLLGTGTRHLLSYSVIYIAGFLFSTQALV